MTTTGLPKPEDCCGGALLNEALRREFCATLLRPDWPAPANVCAAVTTREGPSPVRGSPYGFNVGTHCGDDPVRVARNRDFLRAALRLPAEPCWLQQVHGTRVIGLGSTCPTLPATAANPPAADTRSSPLLPAGEGRGEGNTRPTLPATAANGSPEPEADAADTRFPPLPLAGEGWGEGNTRPTLPATAANGSPEPEADAAVTRTPGVVLAIQTADCLPVLFCAADGSEVAAAHAGWRGLAAGVLDATLNMMNTPRGQILAWLGPAIAAKSYEVGDEVRAAFIADNPIAMTGFTPSRPGHWWCDLYQLARVRLRAAGVTRIFGGGLDTFTDARLHSYRRDGAISGRMASLIWMLPAAD